MITPKITYLGLAYAPEPSPVAKPAGSVKASPVVKSS